jgi:hypothetical protein
MNSNLDLWHAVEKTPPAQTKAITGKSYSGTSPKPYYLIQKATETFGPCGIGWGFVIEDERIEDGAGGERMHIARVKVWYEWQGKRGVVEHIGGTQFSGTRSSGKPFTDEDAPKKSVTDALVKALSMIGFAGDIFMGRYDDSKYVNELRDEERATTHQVAPKAAPAPVKAPPPAATDSPALATITAALKLCATAEAIENWIASETNKLAFNALSDADYDTLNSRIIRWREHVAKVAA